MNVLSRFLVTLMLAIALPVQAGSECSERQLTPEDSRKATEIALRLREALEGTGAAVALVARIGSDVSEQGLRYTHMGAVLRDHPKGRWTFVHALNECSSARHGVYDEGLINFFLDDPFRYEALVIVPTEPLQARLAEILRGAEAKIGLAPAYSTLAYPRAARYGNSNTWLLAMLAVADAEQGAIPDLAAAQRHAALTGYTGDRVRVSFWKRAGARLFRANVRFDDHPRARASQGDLETVTVRSLVRYLRGRGALLAETVVAIDTRPWTNRAYY